MYIVDKVENNPVTVNGKTGTHPAWAVEYDFDTNTCELSGLLSQPDRGNTGDVCKLTHRPTDGCAE